MTTKREAPTKLPDVHLKECDLFELAHVLRVRPVLEEKEMDNITTIYPLVRLWDFYEDSERSLLILLCRNEKDKKETLLVRHYQLYQKAIFKEIPWFQGPVRCIQSLSLDRSGTWLLCSCRDRHLYLVPALALVLGPEEVDCPPHWKNNDLTKFPPHDRKGITTSIVWWDQSLLNTHICILGTELGEIIFVDLHKNGQTVFQTVVEGAVKNLNIVQDKVHGASYLLIQTELGSAFKLLLENYSLERSLPNDGLSLLSADRLGFEMLSQQSAPLHSLIISHQDNSSFQLEKVHCIKSENEAVQLTVQYARNQFFLGSLNFDTKIFEVFDVDRESLPMFIYGLNEFTRKVLLTDRLLFTVSGKRNKVQINIISSQMAETPMAETNTKEKPSSRMQTFLLPPGETVLAIYRFTLYTILEKIRKVGNCRPHPVDGCLVITTAAVYEIRPRVSPEELFVDLAVNNVDTTAADRLAIITGLDVNTLYEQAGDIAMEAGQLRHALYLYQASKCRHSLRVKKFSQYANMNDVITYIQEILFKPDVSSTERKQLANMAVKCFVQQILENNSDSEEMIKLKDDFCQFINDNFDYDEHGALELLASYGLEECLFQVAKARGLVKEALDVLSTKGHYHLSEASQKFLISKGFAEAVCQSSNGTFLRCLSPENTIQLVLAKPESILPHLQYVESLLPILDVTQLLRIAKLFDPSRPAAKTLFLEFASRSIKQRNRSLSGGSQTSMDSYLSFRDDSIGPGIPELLQLFISTLLVLNSKRTFDKFPDMLLISKHCEDKTKSKELEESILRSGVLPEHVTLSCGQEHSALVTTDGDLYTWGKSCNGRLGNGDLMEEMGKLTPFRVELLHIQKIKVQSVACGREHSLALTKQGVYSWGSSDYGQLGLGDNKKQTRPVFVTELADKDCFTLACGYYHSLALSADRNVLAWGWGVHGQLGFGNIEDYLLPARITSLDRCSVIRLAAGYSHTAVLTSQGKVFTFGGGLFGQLGLGSVKKQSTPKLVEEIGHEIVQLLCCGSFETMVVTVDQKFYKWGRNAQLMRHARDYLMNMNQRTGAKKEKMTHYFIPTEVPLKIFSPIVQIRCGNNHAIFLTESGHVYTMGQNDHGQLGLGNRLERTTPVLVQELITRQMVAVAAGAAHCVAIDAQGQTLVWGRSDSGQLGLESTKMKEVSLPTLLKNLPVYKASDKLKNSTESIDDPKLNGLEFEKELSDLSSIGDCLYSREALATSLYQLWGYYNERNVLRRCHDVNDSFSSSVIFKIQEKWTVTLSFRLKALTTWFNTLKEARSEGTSISELESLGKTIIEEVIRSLSDTCTEDYYPAEEAVMVVNEILRFWSDADLNHAALEALFDRHLEFLACPLSLLVLRDASIRDAECTSGHDDVTKLNVTRDVVIDKSRSSYLRRTFRPEFLFCVTKATVEQLRKEFPKRGLFCKDLDTLSARRLGTSALDVSVTTEHALHEFEKESGEISRENLWREILDHFKRNLDKSNAISLSTTAASTLAAASLNLHEEELQKSKHPSPVNVVAFTCEHNFPLVHFIDMIVPEFEQRMGELPKPLTQLAERLCSRYLERKGTYPTSCPVCVYNFLRQEQLQDKSIAMERKAPQPWDI